MPESLSLMQSLLLRQSLLLLRRLDYRREASLAPRRMMKETLHRRFTCTSDADEARPSG